MWYLSDILENASTEIFLDANTSSTLATEQAAQRKNSELELMNYISRSRCFCANSKTKMCEVSSTILQEKIHTVPNTASVKNP